jgi:hypothetical protein
MFGYVVTRGGRGEIDRLLAEVAERLRAGGWALAGAVQQNSDDTCAGGPCNMDLRLLSDGNTIRISQSLGALSEGCRLDPAGLEEAVGRVAATLRRVEEAPRLVIVNKFGRQEAEGRGFRPVIAEALGAGIPVLTGVAHDHEADFTAFAGGMAREVAPDIEAILGWCRASV